MKKKFSFYTLSEREKKDVKGGNVCCCGCAWANCGGSSNSANSAANWQAGLHSEFYFAMDAG